MGWYLYYFIVLLPYTYITEASGAPSLLDINAKRSMDSLDVYLSDIVS